MSFCYSLILFTFPTSLTLQFGHEESHTYTRTSQIYELKMLPIPSTKPFEIILHQSNESFFFIFTTFLFTLKYSFPLFICKYCFFNAAFSLSVSTFCSYFSVSVLHSFAYTFIHKTYNVKAQYIYVILLCDIIKIQKHPPRTSYLCCWHGTT